MTSPSQFDVFLCHNSKDKSEVKQIGQQLKQQGLKPWLDEWELRPGLSLMEQLEETIKKIKSENLKSAAVFIGNNGLGPWQKKEIEVFLNLSTTNKYPLIPVLLSTAPQGAASEFSSFLANNLWVDFRQQQPEPMSQLFWAITGIKLQQQELIQKTQAFEFRQPQQSLSYISATKQEQEERNLNSNNAINRSQTVMQINGNERQQLQQALINAYPHVSNLRQMLSFELDENLDAIAIGDNYSEIVFKLITWTEAQGKIEELLNAACKVNPGNLLLRDFQEQMCKPQSQVLMIQPQVEQQETKKINYQHPYNYETEIALKKEENFLSPNKEIDYKQLEDFLKAEKFQEADQETKKILLLSLGKDHDEKMGVEEIRSLSESILIIIDELWTEHSNQKFGFSVQRSIWQEIISPQKGFISRFLSFKNNEPTDSEQEKWYKFGRYVGWRNQTNNTTYKEKWIVYKNIDFTLNAPTGCFPYFRNWWGSGYAKHHPGRCIALMEKIDKFIK
jgi:hypothetical protein